MPNRREKPPGREPPAPGVRTGASFQIGLLGQPRFVYDDRAFTFPAFRKTLQLLGYLLMRGAAVDRDALAFLFWADDDEETARANLRRNLHLLHQHLPPADRATPWILAEGSTLEWNPASGIRLDVREFEGACDEARCADAVGLYRGDLLDHLYDEWVVPERERLRRRFEDAVRHLIDDHRSRREFGIALGYADRLLATDPWREDLVRVSMAMRYESGDRAGALSAFRTFAKQLREEMDVDPMPETIALRDAILDDADVGAMTGLIIRPRAPSGRESSDLPFVGRAPEFGRLRARYERAVAGEGGLCTLHGEAGIGKTRLVTELLHVAEREGARVLVGTTTSPESVPYEAFVTALRPMVSLLAKSRVPPVWLAALAQMLPALAAHRPDLPPLDEGGDRRDRQRLYEALALAFDELSRPRPLVVALEDLHWAGAATIDALAALRDRLSERRVLFVATYRDDEPALGALRSLRRDAESSETIALGRLPATAIAELAGAPGLAAALTEREIALRFEQAEGHPLFLLDLIAHADDDTSLPPEIDAAIARRLAGVDAGDQLYLDIAATIGATFDIDTVVAIAGGSEREADAALDRLLERSAIRRTSRRTGADFAFTHHLIHRAAYDRVDERSRARFHRRVAGFFSERDGIRSASAAVIGHHYAAGGDAARAAEAFAHAAGRAERLAANAEACAFAERALALARDPHLRVSLLFSLERLMKIRGEPVRRAALLVALGEEAEAAQVPAFTGELLVRQMLDARERADRAAELAIIEALDRHAERYDDPSFAAAAARARAEHARSGDRYDLAIEHAREALALYRAVDDVPATIDVLCTIADSSAMLGWHEDADRHLAEAAALGRRERAPAFEARVLLARAMALTSRQRYAEAAEVSAQAAERYADAGDLDGEAAASDRLGSALVRERRFDEALRAYARAGALYRAMNAPRRVAGSLLNTAMVTIRMHDYVPAEASLDDAVRIFERARDVRGLAIAHTNRAYVLLQLDRPVDAELASRAAMTLLAESHVDYIFMNACSNLGSALYEQGRLDEALVALERAAVYSKAHDRSADRADGLAYVVFAQLDRGAWAEAAEAARELAELVAAGVAISERYLAFWAVARCARACGDREAAATALARALEEAVAREAAARNASGRAAASGRRFVLAVRAASERDEWPGEGRLGNA